jgi:DNA-dependent protein kinase catalytic subunit
LHWLQFIELPGQYKGKQAPDLANHIRISGFDSSVLVMGSLRKPKRLGVRCNDEKEYLILVKGGEDLRLDQRIEQLFDVFNQVCFCLTKLLVSPCFLAFSTI